VPDDLNTEAYSYRPALDGLRAVAVLAVISYHFGYSWLPGGFLGVDLFFVLSGYLITRLLFIEHERTGRVNLAGFWVRRVRRLLPALLLLILAVSAWVYRVGLNWATSRRRRTSRERPLSTRDRPGSAEPPDPAGLAALAALGHLTVRHRAVVVARVLLDLSTAETAMVLDIPENTVKSRLARALASLRNEWYEGRRSKLRKSFTLVMLDMLRLSHQADVWPERHVIKYIRSAIVIDGLIARFAPAFDTGAYLAEVCARHLAADVMERLLSRDGLLEWLAAGSRLLREAPGRALDAAAALWRQGE